MNKRIFYLKAKLYFILYFHSLVFRFRMFFFEKQVMEENEKTRHDRDWLIKTDDGYTWESIKKIPYNDEKT